MEAFGKIQRVPGQRLAVLFGEPAGFSQRIFPQRSGVVGVARLMQLVEDV